jgi:hypothetical protein
MGTKGPGVAPAERAANRIRWQAELAAWRGSGKPLSVWARERGLSRDALQYWKEKLSESHPAPARKLTLIPVPRTTQPTKATKADEAQSLPMTCGVPIELHIGDWRLILAKGFDPETLRSALDVLGARC